MNAICSNKTRFRGSKCILNAFAAGRVSARGLRWDAYNVFPDPYSLAVFDGPLRGKKREKREE